MMAPPEGRPADPGLGEAAPVAQLRVVQADDHAAVQALFARHGWPQRSRAGWDWAFTHHPLCRALGAPMGWVLEAADQVVGFLGNLPQAYRLDGVRLLGATCTSYLVDEAHRGQSVQLMRAFASQPGVDFVHSATANPHSAPVYRLYKFRPPKDPAANQSLRWVANDRALISHVLRQRGLAPLATLLQPCAPVLRWLRQGLDRVGQRALGRLPELSGAGRVQEVPADALGTELGAEWDAWAHAVAAQPGLWLDRGAQALAWRLADPDQPGALALLALRGTNGRLLGMCLLRAVRPAPPAVARAEMLDWCVLAQAPAPLQRALLQHAVQWTWAQDLGLLEAKRYTGQAAQQLQALGAHRGVLAADGNWIRVASRPAVRRPGAQAVGGASAPIAAIDTAPLDGMTLQARLVDSRDWGQTAVDGDDWFNTHRHDLDTTPPASLNQSGPVEPLQAHDLSLLAPDGAPAARARQAEQTPQKAQAA